jgi:hypothetical protein
MTFKSLDELFDSGELEMVHNRYLEEKLSEMEEISKQQFKDEVLGVWEVEVVPKDVEDRLWLRAGELYEESMYSDKGYLSSRQSIYARLIAEWKSGKGR